MPRYEEDDEAFTQEDIDEIRQGLKEIHNETNMVQDGEDPVVLMCNT